MTTTTDLPTSESQTLTPKQGLSKMLNYILLYSVVLSLGFLLGVVVVNTTIGHFNHSDDIIKVTWILIAILVVLNYVRVLPTWVYVAILFLLGVLTGMYVLEPIPYLVTAYGVISIFFTFTVIKRNHEESESKLKPMLLSILTAVIIFTLVAFIQNLLPHNVKYPYFGASILYVVYTVATLFILNFTFDKEWNEGLSIKSIPKKVILYLTSPIIGIITIILEMFFWLDILF